MTKNKIKINGLVLVNKPIGLTSNQVLQRVRRFFMAEKAGHGGTLDPFAKGLLPILLGEACKFSQFFLHDRKQYRLTIAFGAQTDTDDSDGQIIQTKAIPNLKEIDWNRIFAEFLGDTYQTPPRFSALNIDGQRAYDLARAGREFELNPRKITIYSLQLLNIGEKTIDLLVDCSKGSYMRALARDLGEKIGSFAHASQLIRSGLGRFDLDQTVDVDCLSVQNIICLEQMLDLDRLLVNQEKIRFVLNGNDVETNYPDGIYCLFVDREKFIGVGRVKNNRLYPKRLIIY